MVLSVEISEKSFGPKTLFTHLNFTIGDGEKVGVVGRNGIGKTTLFNILDGSDKDYSGDLAMRRGMTMVATSQEYHDVGEQTTAEYITSGLPEFTELSQKMAEFEALENPSSRQVKEYSAAVERFSDKGYYFIGDKIRRALEAFQLEQAADRPFKTLSGGEKRLSEIVKIMLSDSHLALVDEPTNYMDYAAKAQFIEWMNGAPEAILVITHDRDVLANVDRIIEIKDGGAFSYPGNYADYLAQNSTRTVTSMNEYEIVQRRIENLKKQIAAARSKKAGWGGTADKKNPFVVIEERCNRELKKLLEIEKPSFWIDKSSAADLDYKHAARYEKYKARNIKIGLSAAESRSRRSLVAVRDLAVGYEAPIISGIDFDLREGDALEIRGRNGAGKTTLIKAILGLPGPRIFGGEVKIDPHAKISVYEQEVNSSLFDLLLPDAIMKVYDDRGVNITEQKVRSIMDNYLFTEADRNVKVRDLSGGQKARLQIIAMLAVEPDLLVFDEPTSHLDLPSIEELETALARYKGACLYISHDNYFRNKVGGAVVSLSNTPQ
ncbi:ATP-binding cassette domain-containing protein [Candidatus Saccharibacteria bacterium]|nr:ATP-binding cassette domain-containing protein [Candidatus Saccharibacteria bacterium]